MILLLLNIHKGGDKGKCPVSPASSSVTALFPTSRRKIGWFYDERMKSSPDQEFSELKISDPCTDWGSHFQCQ